MSLIRYLTVRVKKHDLEENFFGEKTAKSLIKTLKNTKKPKSSKVEAD